MFAGDNWVTVLVRYRLSESVCSQTPTCLERILLRIDFRGPARGLSPVLSDISMTMRLSLSIPVLAIKDSTCNSQSDMTLCTLTTCMSGYRDYSRLVSKSVTHQGSNSSAF